jgi:hypothetical protein
LCLHKRSLHIDTDISKGFKAQQQQHISAAVQAANQIMEQKPTTRPIPSLNRNNSLSQKPSPKKPAISGSAALANALSQLNNSVAAALPTDNLPPPIPPLFPIEEKRSSIKPTKTTPPAQPIQSSNIETKVNPLKAEDKDAVMKALQAVQGGRKMTPKLVRQASVDRNNALNAEDKEQFLPTLRDSGLITLAVADLDQETVVEAMRKKLLIDTLQQQAAAEAEELKRREANEKLQLAIAALNQAVDSSIPVPSEPVVLNEKQEIEQPEVDSKTDVVESKQEIQPEPAKESHPAVISANPKQPVIEKESETLKPAEVVKSFVEITTPIRQNPVADAVNANQINNTTEVALQPPQEIKSSEVPDVPKNDVTSANQPNSQSAQPNEVISESSNITTVAQELQQKEDKPVLTSEPLPSTSTPSQDKISNETEVQQQTEQKNPSSLETRDDSKSNEIQLESSSSAKNEDNKNPTEDSTLKGDEPDEKSAIVLPENIQVMKRPQRGRVTSKSVDSSVGADTTTEPSSSSLNDISEKNDDEEEKGAAAIPSELKSPLLVPTKSRRVKKSASGSQSVDFSPSYYKTAEMEGITPPPQNWDDSIQRLPNYDTDELLPTTPPPEEIKLEDKVSMEQYLEKMLPKLLSGQVYANRLKGNEQAALTQLLCGLESVKRMSEFFKELEKVEKTYRKALETLIEKENESALSAVQDRMIATSSSWLGILQNMTALANDHERIEIHHQCVASNLDRFFDQAMDQFDHIASEHESVLAAHRTLRDSIKKSKEKCVQTLDPLLNPNLQKSVSKALLKIPSVEKNAKASAYELCSKYDDAIANANHYLFNQKKLHLPVLLSRMQALEEKRIAVEQQQFQLFTDMLGDYTKSTQRVYDSMLQFTYNNNVENDIISFATFIESDTSSIQKAEAELAPFVYDLPMSLNQLRRKMGVKSSVVVDIRAPACVIVEEQKKLLSSAEKQAGLENLKVPRIFTCLKRAIEDLGGFHTEGIFRIPGDFIKTNQILEQVAENDYDLQVIVVHNAASALKKWLRELSDPLVPERLYPLVEEIGREIIGVKERQADKNDAEYVKLRRRVIEEIFNPIDAVDKLMIKGILQLLNDISLPDNVRYNKMTLSNLALIFGPIFVNSKETDPKVLMDLAVFGAMLIEIMAEELDTSDYPVHEEELTKSKLIHPMRANGDWARAPRVHAVQ